MMTWMHELIHAPYAYAAELFSVGHVFTTQPQTMAMVEWCQRCRKESCSLFLRRMMISVSVKSRYCERERGSRVRGGYRNAYDARA